MEIIDINSDNIEREHICCAIADKKRRNLRGLEKGVAERTLQGRAGI